MISCNLELIKPLTSVSPLIICGVVVWISGHHVFVESGVHVVADIAESGIGVQIQSGAHVQISGKHVFVESGVHVVATVTVDISGTPVTISGDHVFVESGAYVVIESGIGVTAAVTVDISGTPVTISGDHVFVESGAFVTIESGVGVTVMVDISGTPVTISGDHVFVESGVHVVVVSGVGVTAGDVMITTPTDLNICSGSNPMLVPNAATPLCSGTSVSVIVKALSVNSGDIYVGGYTAGQQPFCSSGIEQGFLLEPGEGVNIDIDQRGKIQVCACTSGDKVCYISND